MLVSVALLLPEFVSDTPLGAEIEMALVMEPVAVGETMPVRVKVTLFPEARIKPSQRPEALLYNPELGVNTGLRSPAGTASFNVKLLMVLGPLLVTVMV